MVIKVAYSGQIKRELDMAMSKRTEVLLFGKLNGLQVKADRQKLVTAFNPKTNWVDVFNDWDDAYQFFMKAVLNHRDNLLPYPWLKLK